MGLTAPLARAVEVHLHAFYSPIFMQQSSPNALVRRSFFHDLSFPAIAAGFITVLVGYTSSAVIVFQAAQALGASAEDIGSWMWALGIGMGITCILASLVCRIPIVTAWSTPGAAMLMGSAAGLPLPEVMGAFMLAAALTMVAGYTGWFEKMMGRIPMALASGMLAGVLLRFGLDTFVAVQTQPLMVVGMLVAYFVGRVFFARYAVVAALLVGVAVAASQGLLHTELLQWRWAQPIFTVPSVSLTAIFSIALPLFVVTMTAQNMPGVIVSRASGYTMPVSKVVGFIGGVNLLLAGFGAFALNLAAISAAICMGPQASEDPKKRYTAAVCAGVFYIVVGLMGGAVVALFSAFPRELVMAIAGIALLGTLGASLMMALKEEGEREPALIAFLVTASGLSIGGIGAAFWGLVAGIVALWALRKR